MHHKKTPRPVLSSGEKQYVFTCYIVPPRVIKIMIYFVKHPVKQVHRMDETSKMALGTGDANGCWSNIETDLASKSSRALSRSQAPSRDK